MRARTLPARWSKTASTAIKELDPVEATLLDATAERRPGEVVPVTLRAEVTEVGTLELWCVAREGRGRWKLEYEVREREP